ncbi:TetR/AcrR family transcriptional regulator [Planotetraspora sp. A-T 1434]|uniref:TetR/AcrR family transcriptional regulator n=1 Tax=Planotetraspora sp. A-T 1434 TaxID=2979219 RepID=UPI0021BE9119|nr:TetR/AcrR family transcriptional regulator [Planotetraspora sp. A-T 1434]MCT9928980.1 TetR/AcrR family transcriptional regulator [Planotetraspora sp. A-T 1434]
MYGETEQVTRRPGRPGAGAPAIPCTEEILRRGLDAFAELGYEGASVRELARRLGVSHNFINDRYGSKATFWRAVVDFALTEMTEQLEPALEGHHDDIERLGAIITRFYRVAARSPQVNRLIADESVRDSDRLDYLYERYMGPSMTAFTPIVRRLMEAGRIPPAPMRLIYFAITGPVVALTQHPLGHRLGGPEQESPEEVTAAAEALAAFVLHGLLRPPPQPADG